MRALVLFLLLAAVPAAAFHDSNLDPQTKQALIAMMHANPAQAEQIRQFGNYLAGVTDACRQGSQQACQALEQGKQQVAQRQQPLPPQEQGQRPSLPAPNMPPAMPGQRAANLIALQPLQGFRCTALAPQGWQVVNGRNEGDALDVAGPNMAVASYLLLGVPTIMQNVPGYGSPEQVVQTTITSNGQNPARFGQPRLAESGYKVMDFQSQRGGSGFTIYQAFPLPSDARGFVIVIRTGYAQEQQALVQAAGVALSIRCQAQLRVPGPSSPPTGPAGPKRKKKDDDTGYSAQLGMEYAHSERTGENFWVSPSTNHMENGPQGPGYYRVIGNDYEKLSPGRSD